jgi:hypothetical protein
MQLPELDPTIFRKLALHLVGEEQFHLDPAGSILKTFDWLNRVITNEEGQLSAQQNAEIRQLSSLVEKRGLPAISAQLKVSSQTIRAWLYGAQPGPANIEKLKAFLAKAAEPPPPTNAEVAHWETGELFVASPSASTPATELNQLEPGPVPAPQT